IEELDELGQVGGVRIHLVASPRLARATVSSPVMGDRAVAIRGEEEHLRLPTIRVEGPPVAEDHWLAAPPIFEVDRRAVPGQEGAAVLNRYLAHGVLLERVERARIVRRSTYN